MAVTTLQGNYILPNTWNFSAVRVGNYGTYLLPASGGGILNNVYKNQGIYVAGGNTKETWLTSPTPGTVPPSGHTLIEVQHQLLEV